MSKKVKGFNVSAPSSVVQCNKGAEFQLIHPNGDTIPAHITVAGIDSDIYISARRKITDASLKRISKGKHVKKTSSQIDEENIDLLVKCTIGWRGFVGDDESEYKCTAENARKLYMENPWISEQVDEAIADRTLFISG